MNFMSLWALLLAHTVWICDAMRPAISLRGDLTDLLSSQRVKEECESAVDVAFLLDGSYSVRDPDFAALKKFVSKTVSRFGIGPDKLQVGIVQYTDEVELEMDWESDHDKVIAGIDKLKQLGGFTSVKAGLEEVRHLFQKHQREARRILILISDGDVDTGAVDLKKEMESEDKVVVFSVAVGNEATADLMDLASSKQLFFNVSNYGVLGRIAKRLSKYSCDVAEVGATTEVKDIDFQRTLQTSDSTVVTKDTPSSEDVPALEPGEEEGEKKSDEPPEDLAPLEDQNSDGLPEDLAPLEEELSTTLKDTEESGSKSELPTDLDSLNMKDTGRLPIAVGFAVEIGELFLAHVWNRQIHDVSLQLLDSPGLMVPGPWQAGKEDCASRKDDKKGSSTWCACNVKAELISNKDSCEHPGGGRDEVCQWSEEKELCVPKASWGPTVGT
eukprot:s1165_g15.t1